MTRGCIDIKSFIVKRLFNQTWNEKRRCHQTGIQAVFVQFLQDRTGFQLINQQRDFGVLFSETLHKVRHESVGNRRNNTQTKLAGDFVRLLPRQFLQALVFSQDQTRLMQNGFALFRNHDWFFNSIKNDDVQIVFNFSDLLTQGGLRDMTRFSCLTEVFEVCNGNNIFQLNQTRHDASQSPIV